MKIGDQTVIPRCIVARLTAISAGKVVAMWVMLMAVIVVVLAATIIRAVPVEGAMVLTRDPGFRRGIAPKGSTVIVDEMDTFSRTVLGHVTTAFTRHHGVMKYATVLSSDDVRVAICDDTHMSVEGKTVTSASSIRVSNGVIPHSADATSQHRVGVHALPSTIFLDHDYVVRDRHGNVSIISEANIVGVRL